MNRLPVGLIGLGRLGRVYAQELSARIPEARLAAVADPDAAVLAELAREHGVDRSYPSGEALLEDKQLRAVAIVSPTRSHRGLAIAALERGLAVFCEKPPALTLAEALDVQRAVERGGFFQLGFMRRFDAGYAAARRRLEEGAIGAPLVFKSTSRDPQRTSLEFADPRSSGGMILDMGIHDFDVARWFMGEVASVQAVAGVLAYPELRSVGDVDNAIVTLLFEGGRLGVVDLSRSGVYGYDVATELLGSAGTLRIGYLRQTPLQVMTSNSVAHDTVPHFMQRFAEAYTAQLRDFARNVREGRAPAVTIADGLAAMRICVAAQRACESGGPVALAEVGV